MCFALPCALLKGIAHRRSLPKKTEDFCQFSAARADYLYGGGQDCPRETYNGVRGLGTHRKEVMGNLSAEPGETNRSAGIPVRPLWERAANAPSDSDSDLTNGTGACHDECQLAKRGSIRQGMRMKKSNVLSLSLESLYLSPFARSV